MAERTNANRYQSGDPAPVPDLDPAEADYEAIGWRLAERSKAPDLAPEAERLGVGLMMLGSVPPCPTDAVSRRPASG